MKAASKSSAGTELVDAEHRELDVRDSRRGRTTARGGPAASANLNSKASAIVPRTENRSQARPRSAALTGRCE